ncbi:MAG: hypothetical protein QOK43_2775 [Acidimicrobiaceae bacterium]|nr:hypothetical protein [Acidimicrobiaceae bacterium]
MALAGHAADELTARAALDDEAGSVRATALGALRRMERLTADDIRAALVDSDAVVRRRACQVADRMSDVDLLPLLHDVDPTVAETAAWALGEQERDDAETVSALSAMARHHDDPLCRESAVAALGAIGHPDGLAAILAATKDKPAVRRRAVLALAPFEGPEVDAALEAALTDRDWQVRQAAEDLRTTEP